MKIDADSLRKEFVISATATANPQATAEDIEAAFLEWLDRTLECFIGKSAGRKRLSQFETADIRHSEIQLDAETSLLRQVDDISLKQDTAKRLEILRKSHSKRIQDRRIEMREDSAIEMAKMHPKEQLRLMVIVAPVIGVMFRFFADNAVVPQSWKIARIQPVKKKGDLTRISNYRPISLI